MKFVTLIISLVVVSSCYPDNNEGDLHSKVKKESFGVKLENKELKSLENLREELAMKDTIYTTTSGIINEVCQEKGCWMTIKTMNLDKPVFMVKFKDYGFFMPKDIAGDSVVLQGKAFLQVTDVETLKHYASDAGKSNEVIESITSPKEEIIFIADGVELYQ